MAENGELVVAWRARKPELCCRWEFRVSNNGELILGNPELELGSDERAADATLQYRFDAARGEHMFRLVDPVADHAHTKVHRAND